MRDDVLDDSRNIDDSRRIGVIEEEDAEYDKNTYIKTSQVTDD